MSCIFNYGIEDGKVCMFMLSHVLNCVTSQDVVLVAFPHCRHVEVRYATHSSALDDLWIIITTAEFSRELADFSTTVSIESYRKALAAILGLI